MGLDRLVEAVRNYPGVLRKKGISQVTRCLPTGWPGVVADLGEDAAVIERGDECLLLAADGIMGQLVEADPEWAGYCSVLVNVNDIAAMGGTPLAMVNVLSMDGTERGVQVAKGMGDAVRKFGVPMVGGHTHPDAGVNSVEVAILGVAGKDDVLYSHTAKGGEAVVFAMDLDGVVRDGFPHAWDTTSHKSGEGVRRLLDALPRIAKKGLASSCKDISNPGALGTLAMLLESSGKGCTVDLSLLPRPDGLLLEDWVLMYQGCGFVFTCPGDGADPLVRELEGAGFAAAKAGQMADGRLFRVGLDGSGRTLYNFGTDSITGIKR